MAYTDEQRAEAVDLYLQHGLAETHRRTHIPKASLQRWAEAAGHDLAAIAGHTADKTVAAHQAHAHDLESRRQALALGLLDDVARLRDQLFAPCVERKAMVVGGGMKHEGRIEIVDVERDEPTFSEKKSIMTTLAIAIDKVQVLTGEATERIEHREIPHRTPEAEAELDRTIKLVREQAA